MVDIKQLVGDELRRQRRAKGLTQEALAGVSDVSVDFIKRIELGEKQPTTTTLFLLSKGLDITPDQLVLPAYKEWLADKP